MSTVAKDYQWWTLKILRMKDYFFWFACFFVLVVGVIVLSRMEEPTDTVEFINCDGSFGTIIIDKGSFRSFELDCKRSKNNIEDDWTARVNSLRNVEGFNRIFTRGTGVEVDPYYLESCREVGGEVHGVRYLVNESEAYVEGHKYTGYTCLRDDDKE